MGVVTADWSRNVHDLPARLNVINRFIAAGSHLKVHHHLFWPSVLFCTAGRAFIFFNRLEKIADTFFLPLLLPRPAKKHAESQKDGGRNDNYHQQPTHATLNLEATRYGVSENVINYRKCANISTELFYYILSNFGSQFCGFFIAKTVSNTPCSALGPIEAGCTCQHGTHNKAQWTLSGSQFNCNAPAAPFQRNNDAIALMRTLTRRSINFGRQRNCSTILRR